MKRSLFLILSLLILFLFFIMVKSERESRVDIQFNSESFIEGIKIFHKINGKSEWILTAKRADIIENGEKARLSDIEMTVEDRGMTIFADKGFYDFTNKNITIDGKVTAKKTDYSIMTENIELDTKAGNLRTDETVIINGNNFSLQGKGMDIDNTEQKVRIHGDVKATFNN
ncbi:MAG: LPS export ABC transporter periplasmic protein LptC [Nitrospirota bacterium]